MALRAGKSTQLKNYKKVFFVGNKFIKNVG